MPADVQLIAGPARSGKMQRLLGIYRHRLRGSTAGSVESCWLAPNQLALSAIQESLLENSEHAYLQPNLFTFARFAETLIARSPRRIRPITQNQKRRLLSHVIQAAVERGQLKHFARVASTPGFVIQVDEFIAAQKRADVWPEAFQQWCQQRPRSDRSSRELSLLYSAYQQQLHGGELYDAEGRFWAARESLAANPQPFDLVVVNGFNDFTTAQVDILRLLSECCSKILISLTLDSSTELSTEGRSGEAAGGSLLFAKTENTLKLLRKTFSQIKLEILSVPPADDCSLQQLQNQCFLDQAKHEGPRAEQPFDGVEMIAANSELGEIEAIAQTIKTLLHSRKALPEDILVVGRGGEHADAIIASVFPDYGIPYASESRPRLKSEPLVRALLPLLRLQREDWPFPTLLEVINNRLFTRFDECPLEEGHLAGDNEVALHFATQPRVALEYCLRSAQLPAGRTALLEQLEYRQNAASQDQRSETDQRMVQVAIALSQLRQLDQLLAALPLEASIGDWILALEGLLTQLGALKLPMESVHHDSPQAELTPSHSRATVAWKLLRRGLREIEQVDHWSQTEKRSLTLAELQDLLDTIVLDQRLPAPNDAVGRVRILSAESARKLSTKHLCLTGLSEGSFSSTAPTHQGVTDDPPSVSTALPENFTEPGEPKNLRSDAMLLFYELVTRPTESLTLSYPALDSKGQLLPPSPLLTDLERSVGAGRIPRRALSLGQATRSNATPTSWGSFRRQAVEQALAGKQKWLAGLISHPSFGRSGSSILSGLDCVAQRGVRDSYGPYEGLLLSKAAQHALARRFDSKHLWSPSQLEGYAACPFRFFSEQLLGLEPLSELTLSSDARRRGSLLHQVLATIHEQLSRADSGNDGASDVIEQEDVVEQELVQRFLAALDAAVNAAPLRGIEQSLREIERREIEAWAPNYAVQEASYRSDWQHLDEPPKPALFEVRFGPETRRSAAETSDRASTTVPFELDLGDEKIRLTGQIDRVDIGRVGKVTVFNIIDYKSGKGVKLEHQKVRSGHQLQLPLYALAAEQLLLADQQAVALATGYWNIQGKGFDSKTGGALKLRELSDQELKTSEAWQQLQPDILVRVQALISQIRHGQFPVYNQDEQCTRSCSLNTVCRVAQIRSLEKVWPPEEAAP